MRTYIKNYPVILIISLLLFSSISLAQNSDQRVKRDRSADRYWAQVDEKNNQIKKRKGLPWQSRRLEKLRQAKLEDFLNLDEQRLEEFRSSYKKLRQATNELRRERHQSIMKLSRKVKDNKISKSELENHIKLIQKSHIDLLELEHQYILNLSDIFTSEQIARYIIFQDRFEHEIAKKVRGFRNQQGKRKLDSLNKKVKDL